MNYRCQDDDSPSPRVGCCCHSCYRAREMALDPRLIEIARYQPMELKQLSPAHAIVHQCIEYYLAGRVEWASLQIEIIKKLVELNDDTFGRLLKMTSLQSPFIVAGPPA
jgi:hypothetical protein